VCGLATNIQRTNATFELDAVQYNQFSRNAFLFPVSCTIPNSGRWTTAESKPMPYANKCLQGTGWLTGFEEYQGSPSKYKERFLIMLSF
ncbi:hypothetical protein R3P38DRAFT_2482936, partial [Favolaschia claudopus]